MPPADLQAPESITVDDLWRVYIRAQDEAGRWHSISVEKATDKQFDVWVRSKANIPADAQWDTEGWPPEHRAWFCDFLYQEDALSIIKGERADWEAAVGG